MPILIDGNNLLHALPAHHRHRKDVRRFVLEQTRFERITVTIVFDGPPPAASGQREHLGAVTILYSGEASADDVIVRHIPEGPGARSWTVVTDDRGLTRRATERGASVRSLSSWRQRRKRRPAVGRPRAEAPLSQTEVDDWQRFFDGET